MKFGASESKPTLNVETKDYITFVRVEYKHLFREDEYDWRIYER